MKNIIIDIAIVCFFIFMSMACTDGFEEMNKNPLRPNTVEPELVFPFVCKETPNLNWETYQAGDNLGANLYAQYIANTSAGFSHDRYVHNDANVYAGYWQPHYVNILKNVKQVGGQIEQYPRSRYTYQLLRILKAYSSIRMTDLFGDMPYSEAGLGIEQPLYDSQKDIYYDVFKELTEAVDVLNSNLLGQNNLGASDFIYGGCFNKWIKFANSLRLRYAIRLSFIDADKAKKEGEAALAVGIMTSVEDRAQSVTNKNDWGNLGYPLITISHWNEFRVSSTLVEILTTEGTIDDPRLPVLIGQTQNYGKEGIGPRFKGVKNGLPADQLSLEGNTTPENSNVYGLAFFPNWNSRNMEPVSGDWISKPFPVMNYSEVCFLKAEAALRGWNGAGNAKDNYEEGIRASFTESRQDIDVKLLDFTQDDIYITTGKVSWNETDGFEEKLKKIITQKWIALFPNGNEAWTEFRRTGYPKLNPIVRSDEPTIKPENGEFIKKMRYVDQERRINTTHATDNALNGGQGDGANVRVWWDTKRYK